MQERPESVPLVNMTTCDYTIVMIPVNIAVLKAKLSSYLGRVRRGEEVLVMDRNTPVARIVPSGPEEGLVLRPPKTGAAALKGLSIRPLRRRTDVVALLREERDRR